MRLVLDILVEWAALASWVYIRRICREKDEPGPHNSHINFPPRLGHEAKAQPPRKAESDLVVNTCTIAMVNYCTVA